MTARLLDPNVLQVGAPDPELRTSPIVSENDDDFLLAKQRNPGAVACYFNNIAYDNNAYVQSGTYLLHCNYGLWLVAEEAQLT